MPLPRPTRQVNQPEPEKQKPVAYRPSDVFIFDPKPDITPEELAKVVSVFWSTLNLSYDRFASLDDDLRRHFEPTKIAKDK